MKLCPRTSCVFSAMLSSHKMTILHNLTRMCEHTSLADVHISIVLKIILPFSRWFGVFISAVAFFLGIKVFGREMRGRVSVARDPVCATKSV